MTKISIENAEVEVKKILDYYDIEVEEGDTLLARMVQGLVKAVSKGLVEVAVDGDGIVIQQHLVRPVGTLKTIKYNEITGACKRATGRIKEEGDVYGKIYALLAAMAHESSSVFDRMRAPDISIAEKLGMIFLQV